MTLKIIFNLVVAMNNRFQTSYKLGESNHLPTVFWSLLQNSTMPDPMWCYFNLVRREGPRLYLFKKKNNLLILPLASWLLTLSMLTQGLSFLLKMLGEIRRSLAIFPSFVAFGDRLDVEALSKRLSLLFVKSSVAIIPERLGLDANCGFEVSGP